MSDRPPNYYEILGLTPAATPDEIKKRYRELARRFHPDVNPNPNAAQQFKTINEAHHVLGDADRRSTYDAERVLRQNAAPRPAPAKPAAPPSSSPQAAPFSRGGPPPSSNPGPPPRSNPTQAAGRMEFDGFGRVPQNRPNANNAARPAPPRPKTVSPFGQVERLMAEAQLAFINRRYREAQRLCVQALSIDRRNAVVHEMLGDILMKQGERERASVAYSYAVQFNPRNVSAQTKLERLDSEHRKRPAPGPTVTRRLDTTPGWHTVVKSENREAGMAVMSALLTVLFVGMLALLWEFPGYGLITAVPWLTDLSFALYFSLVCNGFIAGVLLAFYGGMRSLREELLTPSLDPDTARTPIALGALLTLFALVWFYASLMVYVGVSIARNRLSLSTLRAYGVTLLLTALFAAVYRPGNALSTFNGQVVAFAGNFLFPSVLLGWGVGDAIRLRGLRA